TIRIAVCSGIKYAQKLLDVVRKSGKEYHFVEVMACPGGCIGGGGQPRSMDTDIIAKRMDAIYSIDSHSAVRRSHENPEIQALYANFLGTPNGHLAHELLHTHFEDRSALVTRPKDEDEDEEAEVCGGAGPRVGIVYATQTGNTKDLASQLAADLNEKNRLGVKAKSIDKLDPASLSEFDYLVYMTCTFGVGEQPDSAADFVKYLAGAKEGTFKDTKFCVFGTGSTAYELYCKAALEIDAALAKLGGTRLMDCVKADESVGYEGFYAKFLDALVPKLPEGCPVDPVSGIPFLYTVEPSTAESVPVSSIAPNGYDYLLSTAATDSTLTLDLPRHVEPGLYKVSIHVPNADEMVQKVLKRFDYDNNAVMEIKQSIAEKPIFRGVTHVRMGQLFRHLLALQAPAGHAFLRSLASLCTDDAERHTLEQLLKLYPKQVVSYIDIILRTQSTPLCPSFLTSYIPPMKPQVLPGVVVGDTLTIQLGNQDAARHYLVRLIPVDKVPGETLIFADEHGSFAAEYLANRDSHVTMGTDPAAAGAALAAGTNIVYFGRANDTARAISQSAVAAGQDVKGHIRFEDW
ncbi:flavodoxin, partial [Kipferlia bialata]